MAWQTLLLNEQASVDEYGTSIVRYVDEYAGYNVPNDITGGISVSDSPVEEVAEEPIVPDSPVEEIAEEPIVPDYNFTDSVSGSDGVANSFSFSWDWGKETLIENFDPAEDSVDLRQFWFANDDGYSLGNDSNGNAVIDIFSNNQTIVLDGVSESQLQTGENLLTQYDL